MDYSEDNISLSNYLDSIDLNEDLKGFYDIINDENKKSDLEEKMKLDTLRNLNHKDYYSIDISKMEDLPSDFSSIVEEIKSIYYTLESDKLLIEDESSANESRKKLNDALRYCKRLDAMVKNALKELEEENDKKQSRLSIAFIKNLDCDFRTKSRILALYNDLVLYNAEITKDNYENLKREIIRKKYIHQIYMMLNIEEAIKVNDVNKERLDDLNDRIKEIRDTIEDKILYLQDLISKNSKYTEEFNEFINFYYKIANYDTMNYENARQTYEILSDNAKFIDKLKTYETLFIEEFETNQRANEFVYEKVGIKNIKTSLDYISANYMDVLPSDDKKEIENIYSELNSEYDIDDVYKRLLRIVKRIWSNSITDIYSYNPTKDFCFICSNNQFIDPKYQCILITNKELEKVDDFSDYQIGFICDYKDNIMYITENEDIMTVEHEDMSNLKTPIQLEQEFINFKVCNRIALNGFLTKLTAVYFIDDGDSIKYEKAVELSNMYSLPLIILNKK